MSPSATLPNSRNSRPRKREAGVPAWSLAPVRLPTALMKTCCRRCQQFDFPKGQHLFYEGHDSYGLFVVGSGAVRLEREQPGGGKAEAGAGSLLGARELLTGSPHGVTAVVASDHAKVCFIDKTAFLTMIVEQQPLGQAILKAILKD